MRSLPTCGLVVLALAIGEIAAAQPCPPFQVRNRDGNYIVPGVLGGIPYSGDLALDAYVQPGSGPRPAVVVVHGGRWSSGSRAAHVGQLLEMLTREGYQWVSVDYRLGGAARAGESVADVRAALAFVRCHARQFRVDPSKLILLGEDSGADLAAMLADERPAGVVGAVSIGGFYERGGTPKGPPLLMVHGGADTESPVDRARQHCSGLVRAGRRCTFVEVPGASHRVENWWPNQWGYKREIAGWLSALAPVRGAPDRVRAGPLRKDIVYDKGTQLALDAYVPRSGALVPGVMVVHGGGWEAGDKVTYVTPLFEPLARAGYAWFSIDYRLTPAVAHEDQLEDLRRAVRFVRAEHARFNVDPARIVLVGESASGQMVAQLAAEDPSLAGVVSLYGVYDLPAMVTDASPRSLLVRLFRRTVLDEAARALLRKYSPLYSAHAKMAPILLVGGTADRLWPQTQAYAARLAELGVSHDVIALEGAPHGLENWEGRREWAFYKRRVVEWIRRLVPRGTATGKGDTQLNRK